MKGGHQILYYKDYFISFYRSWSKEAQKKFEVRATHDGNIYRAFFIFDEGNVVMLFNGFQNKTQKTPESEINKAIQIKNEYYASKK